MTHLPLFAVSVIAFVGVKIAPLCHPAMHIRLRVHLCVCVFLLVAADEWSLNNRSTDYYLSLNRHATPHAKGVDSSAMMGMNEAAAGISRTSTVVFANRVGCTH